MHIVTVSREIRMQCPEASRSQCNVTWLLLLLLLLLMMMMMSTPPPHHFIDP